jgi:ribosomal protein S18 acetylase RimI-like enzyme
MTAERPHVLVRQTNPADFAGIIELARRVYPHSPPWSERQLASHLEVFPQGQFVAINQDDDRVVGMAASLIVLWDDYEISASWRDFTAGGTFSNHDPVRGRTLYGAEVMTDPAMQGRGVGTLLYSARRALAERLGLLRHRAGARNCGYHRHAVSLTPEDYVERVVRGELRDPTLSFQLGRGFHVLDVVPGYLRHDPESLGWAAVIEWVNPAVAKPEDYRHGNPRYRVAGSV